MEVVWPRECSGRAQIHPDWTISCGTKMDLIQEIESWVRMNSARRERHLIKLGYCCPECQHGLCTAMSKCLLHCTAASRTDARQRGEGRCWRPCTPCIGSFGAGAGRCLPPRTPCIGSFGAGASRCSPPRTPCIGSLVPADTALLLLLRGAPCRVGLLAHPPLAGAASGSACMQRKSLIRINLLNCVHCENEKSSFT